MVLPTLIESELKRVKEGQKREMCDKLRLWLANPETVLEGDKCLPLSAELRSILSHFSLFRLHGQGVIFRIFLYRDHLLMIVTIQGGEELDPTSTLVIKRIDWGMFYIRTHNLGRNFFFFLSRL